MASRFPFNGLFVRLPTVPGLVKAKEHVPGGLAEGKPASSFDPALLAEGQRVEMEHTTDPNVALEIAKDHLTEDLQYYKKLKKIEKAEGEFRGGDPEEMELKRQEKMDELEATGGGGEEEEEPDPGDVEEAELEDQDKADAKSIAKSHEVLSDHAGVPLSLYQGNDHHEIHGPEGGSEHGIYLTPSRSYAAGYGRNLHRTWAKVRNPKVVENKGEITSGDLTKEHIGSLKKQGHDSIIVKNPGEPHHKASEIVLFHKDNLILHGDTSAVHAVKNEAAGVQKGGPSISMGAVHASEINKAVGMDPGRMGKLGVHAAQHDTPESFSQADLGGVGAKPVSHVVSHIDSSSHTNLDLDKVRSKVSEPGNWYFQHKVSVGDLDPHSSGEVKPTGKEDLSKPIVVNHRGEIVDGRHRVAHAQQVGVKEIPAYVPAHTMYGQLNKGGPSISMGAAMVSPVDTGEDYNRRGERRGQEGHQGAYNPLEFRGKKQPWIEPGPSRVGREHELYSETVGIRVPLTGNPIQHLRRYKADVQAFEKERSLMAKGEPKDADDAEDDKGPVMAGAREMLGQLNQMGEDQLREFSKKIWGDDFEYEDWADEDYIRQDVIGSVMDMMETASAEQIDEVHGNMSRDLQW